MFSKNKSGGLRRSVRLKFMKEKKNRDTKMCNRIALWDDLPLEMKHKILSYIPISDLRKFAMSSENNLEIVLRYVQSVDGLSAIMKELCSEEPHCSNTFCIAKRKSMLSCNLGYLLKTVTLFRPTKERLTIVHNIFTKGHIYAHSLPVGFWKNRPILIYFGHFAHAFISAWEKEDILYAHNFLQTVTKIEKLVNETLCSVPGSAPSDEKFIREYYRSVYVDTSVESEKGVFLAILLKHLPYVHQARLLYILYGLVTDEGFIDWTSPLQVMNGFVPFELNNLAVGTQHLYSSGVFTEDNVLTLIQEVCAIPQPWHPLNEAHYFMSCGEKVLSSYMSNLLANGRYFELAVFIIQCAATCFRLAKPLNSLLKLLNECTVSPEINELDGRHFIISFPSFLRDIQERANYHGNNFGVDQRSMKKIIKSINEAIHQREAEVCLRNHADSEE